MATGKTRQISVTRAQKLPPIREETFSSRGGSGNVRISVKPQAKYEVLRTSDDPPKPRPTVHARPYRRTAPSLQKNEGLPNISPLVTKRLRDPDTTWRP